MAGETLLVVDDEENTRTLIAAVLTRQGFTIIEAANGASALKAAQEDPPHLIILDMMMPDMSGLEVTRRLRADPQTADVPILMFSARGLVDDKVEGFEAGVDDYLTKPAHPAELTARVKTLLAAQTGDPDDNQ